MIKKRGLLYQLILAIFIPAFIALVMAWAVYAQFESTMSSIASDYVENLVDSVVARVNSREWNITSDADYMNNRLEKDRDEMAELLKGVVLPGTFAVFSRNGTLIYGTPGEVNLLADRDELFDSQRPVKIRGGRGRYYTGMFYPLPDKNLYIIGAVSWQALFGLMVLLVTIWPFAMGALAAFIILAIYLLYEKVILPLRDLDREIASLALGRDLPVSSAPEAVAELQKLRSTLALLAQSAIDKENLSREYVTDLIKAQEEERERISRELHDGPLQDVTALVQRLRILAAEVGVDSPITEPLNNAGKIAMFSVKEMREFCNNLTPPWLDLGLSHSLTELCNRMSAQFNMMIELDVEDIYEEDDCCLPPSPCLAFYRVAQESINNSVKHGCAKSIYITLKREEDRIVMRIEDDGKGFEMPEDIKELRVRGHRGLSNMSERIRIAGGRLEVKSTLGVGTIISCEVPAQRVK
ncbi:MAG: histidine kinase [Synergistaceae bacterium]|nr:histidine kinase [Synergistaceae bacterium]